MNRKARKANSLCPAVQSFPDRGASGQREAEKCDEDITDVPASETLIVCGM